MPMLLTDTDTPVIDFDANPAPWGHRVLLRGVVCPLLPPQDVDADNDPWVRSGLLGIALGMAHRAWSAIVGRTPLALARERVARMLPPDYRSVAASLSGAECLMLDATYTGLQRRWHQHYTDAAISMTRPPREPHAPAPAPGTAPAAGTAAAAAAAVGARAVMTQVAPGGRLPGWLGGERVGAGREREHAVLSDTDTRTSEEGNG